MEKTTFNRLIQKKIASAEKEAKMPFATEDEANESALDLALNWTPESGLNKRTLSELYGPESTDDDVYWSGWFNYEPEGSLRRVSAYSVLDESGVTDENAVERLQERFEKFNNGVTVSPENLKLTKKDKLKSILAGVTASGGTLAAAFGLLLGAYAIRTGSARTGLQSAALTLGGAGILAASISYNNRLKERRVQEFLKAEKDYKEAFSAGLGTKDVDYDFIGNVYNGNLDPTIANVAKARGMINAATYRGERFRNMIKDLTELDLEKDVKKKTLNAAEALGTTARYGVVDDFLNSKNVHPDMSDVGYIVDWEEEGE